MFGLFKKTPKEQQKILFFCGAGVSQESGINTFRDSNGLWENHDIDKVCNFNTFLENKEEVFNFYNERKKEVLKAKPNLAHKSIAKIQNNYGIDNVIIFTSNIDNLLTQAGCKNVIHIHGNMFQMQCLNCENIWNIGDEPYNINSTCPKCSSDYIKPFIVFFHEPAPLYKNLWEIFEKGGPVIKGEIVNNIKVIIGTSFKVIKPETFRLSRGKSIVVDTVMPELKGQKCDKIILSPATQAFNEVNNLINDWYRKN